MRHGLLVRPGGVTRPRRRLARFLAGFLAAATVVPAVATAAPRVVKPGPWHLQTLPGGASFAEPGLAAGPHRTLLANACTANTGRPATFWRSTNDGRSWSRGFTVGASAIGCGDADTAIGSDGYEYAAVLGTGVSVYRSRDGKTWSAPAAFPPPHGEDQPDRPWLVTVPGRPNVVNLFNSEGSGDIVEWTSTDHAATFSGPLPVTGGTNSQAALTLGSRPLVIPKHPNRMRLLYETATASGVTPSVTSSGIDQFPLSQLWEASSNDGGRSWTNTLVLDVATVFHRKTGTIGHLLPAATVDRRGTVYVVLSVQLGTSRVTHLYLLHSTRSGGWTHPVRVDHAGPSNVYPAVAAVRPGHLVISWYGSRAPSFDSTTARWREFVSEVTGALRSHPRFRTRKLGAVVHVGAIEQAGAVGSDLGEDWSLRDFQSATVDSCGTPHIIWASNYRSKGRVVTATPGGHC